MITDIDQSKRPLETASQRRKRLAIEKERKRQQEELLAAERERRKNERLASQNAERNAKLDEQLYHIKPDDPGYLVLSPQTQKKGVLHRKMEAAPHGMIGEEKGGKRTAAGHMRAGAGYSWGSNPAAFVGEMENAADHWNDTIDDLVTYSPYNLLALRGSNTWDERDLPKAYAGGDRFAERPALSAANRMPLDTKWFGGTSGSTKQSDTLFNPSPTEQIGRAYDFRSKRVGSGGEQDEAEQNGTLTRSQANFKLNQLQEYVRYNQDTIDRNNKTLAEGGIPVLQPRSIAHTAEWASFYLTLTGQIPQWATLEASQGNKKMQDWLGKISNGQYTKRDANNRIVGMRFVDDSLFETKQDFLDASRLYRKYQQMDDDQKKQFQKDNPDGWNKVQYAQVTNQLGLPVPGEGMPASYRYAQAALYNLTPASYITQGIMHRSGLTSGSDVLGTTKDPMDRLAGHAGGLTGMALSPFMKANVPVGASKAYMNAARYTAEGGWAAPFALVDDTYGNMFAKSQPLIRKVAQGELTKGRYRLAAAFARTAQYQAPRAALGGGLLGAGMTALESNDLGDIAQGATFGVLLGGGISLGMGAVVGRLTGGSLLATGGDHIRRFRANDVIGQAEMMVDAMGKVDSALSGLRNADIAPEFASTLHGQILDGIGKAKDFVGKMDELKLQNEIDTGKDFGRTGIGLKTFLQRTYRAIQAAGEHPEEFMLDGKTLADVKVLSDIFGRKSQVEQARYALNRPEFAPSIERMNFLKYAREKAKEKGQSLGEWLKKSQEASRAMEQLRTHPMGMELIAKYEEELIRYAKDNDISITEAKRRIESGEYPMHETAKIVARKMGFDEKTYAPLLVKSSNLMSVHEEVLQVLMDSMVSLDGKRSVLVEGSPEYNAKLAEAKATRRQHFSQLREKTDQLLAAERKELKIMGKNAEIVDHPYGEGRKVIRIPATQSDYNKTKPRFGRIFEPVEFQEGKQHTEYNHFELTPQLARIGEQLEETVTALEAVQSSSPQSLIPEKVIRLPGKNAVLFEGEQSGRAYFDFVDQFKDPQARAQAAMMVGNLFMVNQDRRLVPHSHMGFLNEYKDIQKQIEREGTALKNPDAASWFSKESVGGGESFDLFKAVTLMGRHSFDVIGDMFGTPLVYMTLKDLSNTHMAMFTNTLVRFQEVNKRYGTNVIDSVIDLLDRNEKIPWELKAVADEIRPITDDLFQFVLTDLDGVRAKYRQDYFPIMREKNAEGFYGKRLFDIPPENIKSVSGKTGHAESRTSQPTPSDYAPARDRFLAYTKHIYDKFYGKIASEYIDSMFGMPDHKVHNYTLGKDVIRNSIDDASSYLNDFLSGEFLGYPSAIAKRGRQLATAIDWATAARYSSDLVLNVNTHIKNGMQPFLMSGLTGGIDNFFRTSPYRFHPEMDKLAKSYQPETISNYFNDILQSAKEYEALARKRPTMQQLVDFASRSYNWIEIQNRAMAFTNSFGYHLEQGWTAEEAISRAVMDVHRSQFMYGRMGSPMLLRQNPLLRLGFMYSFEYRYLDQARRVMEKGEYDKAIAMGMSALTLDYVLAPLIYHDTIYSANLKKLMSGEGNQSDLEDVLFNGATMGGAKELGLMSGMSPSPQYRMNFDQLLPGAKPLIQATQKLGAAVMGDPESLADFTSVEEMLLGSTSPIGSIIPGRAQIKRVADYVGRHKNSIDGELWVWTNSSDASRRKPVASLSPLEDITMLTLGNTPETSRYWSMREIQTAEGMVFKTKSNMLEKRFRNTLIDEYTQTSSDANARLDEEIRTATTADWGRVSWESVTNMFGNADLYLSALSEAIPIYEKKVKAGKGDRLHLEKLKLYQEYLLGKSIKDRPKSFRKASRGMMSQFAESMKLEGMGFGG